jgi:hypothetical protein
MRLIRMSLGRLVFFAAVPGVLLQAFGCERAPTRPGGGPFGEPEKCALLSPFAGAWVFDLEETLGAQKAAGATEKQLEQARRLYGPSSPISKWLDMTITGNEAVGAGMPSAEYRFFAVHKHGGKVCGKAWHHEDRFDPGDMSKCYVRMRIENNDLYFEVRMKEGLPDLNDPDLVNPPPAEAGSAADCRADAPPGTDWSPWVVYVFVRKR